MEGQLWIKGVTAVLQNSLSSKKRFVWLYVHDINPIHTNRRSIRMFFQNEGCVDVI